MIGGTAGSQSVGGGCYRSEQQGLGVRPGVAIGLHSGGMLTGDGGVTRSLFLRKRDPEHTHFIIYLSIHEHGKREHASINPKGENIFN